MKARWGWKDVVLAVLIIIPVAATWYFYDRLPEQMAVHFSMRDEQPDGYASKQGFLLTELAMLIGLPLLLSLGRRLDPKRDNYSKFQNALDIVRLALVLTLTIVFGYLLMYNAGYELSASGVVSLVTGLVFMVFGNYLGQIRVNYLIGIRTPWTLNSAENWRRTHRFSGPVWVLCGLAMLMGMFLPGIVTAWLIGLAVGVASLVPILYSYRLFRKG